LSPGLQRTSDSEDLSTGLMVLTDYYRERAKRGSVVTDRQILVTDRRILNKERAKRGFVSRIDGYGSIDTTSPHLHMLRFAQKVVLVLSLRLRCKERATARICLQDYRERALARICCHGSTDTCQGLQRTSDSEDLSLGFQRTSDSEDLSPGLMERSEYYRERAKRGSVVTDRRIRII
jgi:hypothetical protein